MKSLIRGASLRAGALHANVLALAGLSLGLSLAFYYQLAFHELPCPLCQLQRIGLIAIGLGFMMNLQLGIRPAHYGVVLVGCLLTGAPASRQVLLHILPGDAGFGSTFLGLHFYTWAVATAVGMAALTAGLLMTGAPRTAPAPWVVMVGRVVVWVFVALIAANLLSTLLECGLGGCDSNPTYYRLLGR